MQAKQGDLLAKLDGTMVVSCQAEPGMPLDAPAHIAAMARSAMTAVTAIAAAGRAGIAAPATYRSTRQRNHADGMGNIAGRLDLSAVADRHGAHIAGCRSATLSARSAKGLAA